MIKQTAYTPFYAKVLRWTVVLLYLVGSVAAGAQERKVENRPYTDLRPFHFGVVVGTHFQDLELNNVGPVTFTDEEGNNITTLITADQDRWDPGFQVGVLGEARLGTHFSARLAPMMYFGNRHITFHNFTEEALGNPIVEKRQDLKSVYVAGVMDLIYSAKRFNNHRPYVTVGVTPMINLSSRDNDYLRIKQYDVFFTAGMGCDFYLPFFKLRPELKFMWGLTNSLDTNHATRLKDINMRPYAMAVDKTRSKMICLSFYFE